MTPRQTAGTKLRKAMDRALAQAAEDLGEPLDFTEMELAAVVIACQAADRTEQLQKVYDAELANPAANPNTLTKLSAELRGLERQQLDAIGRVKLDPDYLSNVRRNAVRQRWGQNCIGGTRTGSGRA